MITIIILIVTNTQKIAHFDLFDQTSFKKYQECMKAFFLNIYRSTMGNFLQKNQLPHASKDASRQLAQKSCSWCSDWTR